MVGSGNSIDLLSVVNIVELKYPPANSETLNMSSKSIGFYLFCNTVEQVLLAEKVGVDGIMLNWEFKGKS